MIIFPLGTIAVVGNGPGEIGRGRGAEIDAHDSVIRFNNYRLGGFEKDYGARTTHWATTYYMDVTPRKELFKAIYCTIPALDPNFIRKYLHAEHSLPNYSAIVKALRNGPVHFLPFPIIYCWGYCSSGLCLLLWMHAERTMKGVDLYGFDFFDQSKPHHYFKDDEVAMEGASSHRGEEEREICKTIFSMWRKT